VKARETAEEIQLIAYIPVFDRQIGARILNFTPFRSFIS
jgi:hypothetical protein